jgi:hypothetical protein
MSSLEFFLQRLFKLEIDAQSAQAQLCVAPLTENRFSFWIATVIRYLQGPSAGDNPDWRKVTPGEMSSADFIVGAPGLEGRLSSLWRRAGAMFELCFPFRSKSGIVVAHHQRDISRGALQAF